MKSILITIATTLAVLIVGTFIYISSGAYTANGTYRLLCTVI